MCGISGIIAGNISNPGKILKMMNDLQAHRGPDDEGIYESAAANGRYYIGLAHRRLSIIDLSTGHQPMFNEDGTVVIVFNGEIYNFKDLQKELIQKGHRFITSSDTEAVIHAYEEYGESCVERMRGMFAFAIWDSKRERVFIARDRFGKKPLFYYKNNDALVFSSEIKSLLQFPADFRKVDENAVMNYLIYRYVPAPDTLFSGIYKLMPGTWATWENGNFNQQRYYNPPDGMERKEKALMEDPVTSFLELLDQSVEVRMISDVPFGAFLSGGIDSSAIVALMTRHSPFAIKTFSVGFEEEKYNEASYARIIAEKFKTDHHELTISADHLMEELPGLIRYRDAPVSETSDIPIYLLSKFARQSVKMVLTGEGSDEMLGGYPKHVYEKYVTMYQYIPAVIRSRVLEPMIRALPYGLYRAKTAIINLGITGYEERFPRWFGALTRKEMKELLMNSEEFTPKEGFQFKFGHQDSYLRKILFFDQTSWLPDNLLERGDRMTMAASLEGRMPFMDHTLAEFVSSLPDNFRVRGHSTKWILRQAMRPILPGIIIDRPKIGFRVPVNEWFQTTMKDYLYDHLTGTGSITKRYYNKPVLMRILGEHTSGRQNHEKLLWSLLNLELWHREYMIGN